MEGKMQYFRSEDAAKILGVNVSTIKRWTEEGKLDCIKTAGGHRKFLLSHLAAFLEKNPKKLEKINLFPMENKEDLQISYHIMQRDFNYLVQYILEKSLACRRDRVQQALNGLYLAQIPLHNIYDDIVTPVLRQIGDMWENGKLTVTLEHLASQTLRDSLIRLQGIIRLPDKKEKSALCLTPSTELHDIALKMVDQLLEVQGYQILFSGQYTPVTDIKYTFEKFKPNRLYISSTIIENQKSTQEEMNILFDLSRQYAAEVFVGGQGFNLLDYKSFPGIKRLHTFEDVYRTV